MPIDWRGCRSSATSRCVSGHSASPGRSRGRTNSSHLDERNGVPGDLLPGVERGLDIADPVSAAAPGARGTCLDHAGTRRSASQSPVCAPFRSSHGLISGYRLVTDCNQSETPSAKWRDSHRAHAHCTNAPLRSPRRGDRGCLVSRVAAGRGGRTVLDVPDADADAQPFGRHGSGRGQHRKSDTLDEIKTHQSGVAAALLPLVRPPAAHTAPPRRSPTAGAE